MARFLITGAKGQVGHCLTKQLQGKADILAVDREELDITKRDAVFNVVREFRPDVIINAAAHTAVDRAESEVELSEAINVKGPQYLAEAANEVDAIILHISTDYVFEGTGSGEYKENDEPNPQGVYGKTKLAGEIAVQQANKKHIILRTAWVFGEHGNNFVKTMLRLGKERDVLGIVSDQFGGPTYAGDIAKALIQIANAIMGGRTDVFGIYHFTGKPYVSWADFANAIFDEAVLQKVIEKAPLVNFISTSDYPTPAKRPANSRLDLTKIDIVFGIKPSNWQQALKNIKAYV
ncbi:dTDP-4-dehydrorhamnose reductase [Actinobacillus pleuropneumoniae]|uniref:dTDP-4-dehydrorhamnose reductase n=2 Tax=Actinobacillus pleuropneumoniae TaxID=715 RepID=A0A897Q5L7_ACTPL|nr:dTDP-4-dehydrorhamnose reductase [Actinobacillus pleuropneumoniae]QSG30277.1 dTDP-4-dehydrorhamnose reductase [Actinobacillus pleuropneumoniae serovar 19]ACE62125.1 dTDP-4-dehydrorhamnose reductase [Actinobacillus pleuropneumoniae serovar 7 str. AP76]EFM89364.1 dTDP-4-dehydrorhamnose reductase [Actinobacillus pleuropneumoniae serovar 4 str. M62]EFN02268.1 dTDP-4-dehydrorhamnose reductase [Actinobacillus pleuropneumoniae serovar 13 str. N273]MCL7722155.1 dTDP-4-dehydrorhamnose reductase [Act